MPCRRGRVLEHIDERVADAPPLLLRILDPFERREKALGRIDRDQLDPEVRAKGLLHLLALVQPQQPMIDEDARELRADRSMYQRRRHR